MLVAAPSVCCPLILKFDVQEKEIIINKVRLYERSGMLQYRTIGQETFSSDFTLGVQEKDGVPYSVAMLCIDKVPRLRLEGAPNRIPRPSPNLHI